MNRRIALVIAVLMVLASCGRSKSASENAPLWEPPKEVLVEIDRTLGCPEVTDAPNQWIAFRKDVRLDAVPASAPARIAVDSKYWLWVNGRLVVALGERPARGLRRRAETRAQSAGQLFR